MQTAWMLFAASIGFWNWAKLITVGILVYFVYVMFKEDMVKTKGTRVAVALSVLVSMALSYSLYVDFAEWWAKGPTGSRLFAANPGPGKGSFVIDGVTYELAAGAGTEIEFMEGTAPHKIVGKVGAMVVLDTVMGDGSYLGSLNSAHTVTAEQVVFSDNARPEPNYRGKVRLKGPGILRFTMDPVIGVYGFDAPVPKTISVGPGTHTARMYSVKME